MPRAVTVLPHRLTRARRPCVVCDDVGWSIQTAMESWAGRADLKASILLALQGAALVLLATGRDELAAASSPWPSRLSILALTMLVAAASLAAWAVMPRLGAARHLRGQYHDHPFFFGHIRHYRPDALAARLAGISRTEQHVMLAHHLVAVSRINWRKYRLLQASVLLTIAVIVDLAVTYGLTELPVR